MSPEQLARYSPSSGDLPRPTLERLVAELPQAVWTYDEDADEMEVQLPNGGGRAGHYTLLQPDLYVRLHVDTAEPLGVMIPAYSLWLADRLRKLPAPAFVTPAGFAVANARRAEEALRRELAGAAS